MKPNTDPPGNAESRVREDDAMTSGKPASVTNTVPVELVPIVGLGVRAPCPKCGGYTPTCVRCQRRSRTERLYPTEAGLLSWYTCQRKVRHSDMRSAAFAAHATAPGVAVAYACDRCHGWHTGKPSRTTDVLNARQRRKRLVRRARKAWREAGRPNVASLPLGGGTADRK